MKENRNKHHAGRIISLFIVLCMVLAIVPITAFAGVEDVTGGTPSTVYKHTYHTKVKMTANVTVQDSDGNTVNTYPVSEESADYIVGNVSDDAVQAEISRLEASVNSQLPSGAVKSNHTTETTFDHFESSYILETDKEGNTTSTLDVHEYQIYEITDEWTVKLTTQKEIELIEINNATLTFKDGDKPVFTGTTPDGAPYVLDYESWFGEDGKFISSSNYWNSAYVERDWCDGLISSFSENIEYTYGLYVKLKDEAAARGYVFGPNTKLKINGKDVEYVHSDETSIALQIMSNLTMTPTKAAAPDYGYFWESSNIDISDYTVTLKESSVNATGYAQTPVITSVKKGEYYSLSSYAYTVSYQDAAGKTVTSMSAPGTYKVIVTGKNGYSGSTYATFTIVGTPQTLTVAQESYKKYPTSDPFKIRASATGDGTGFAYTSSNPDVASVSSKGYVTVHKVGRAVITVTTTGNNVSEPVSRTVEVKVYPEKTVISQKPWTDGKKAQMRVRWNYQDGAVKYQIMYSRDKNFKSGNYSIKTVNAHGKDYTTQSTTISNLKRGYTYYFKVRAIYIDPSTGDTYYGKWSNWRSAKTK